MCLNGEPGGNKTAKDSTCTGDAARCCGNCGDAGVGGYGVAKSPAELRVAKMLHEAGREAVKQNLVVRQDVPNNGFIEWDQLTDAAREGRFIQARFVLERYVMLPADNTAACSGCRTCTDALDRLDCARRDFIAVLEEARTLRSALAGLIGGSTEQELKEIELGLRLLPAPSVEVAIMLNGVRALLKSVYSLPLAAAVCPDPVGQYHRAKEGLPPCDVTAVLKEARNRAHEECGYCARADDFPPTCAGHPGGSASCVRFKGAEVC